MNDSKNNRIDVNLANLEELISVPGLNNALAEEILQKRPFQSFDDLTRVKGIGKRSLEKFRDYLNVFEEEEQMIEEVFEEEIFVQEEIDEPEEYPEEIILEEAIDQEDTSVEEPALPADEIPQAEYFAVGQSSQSVFVDSEEEEEEKEEIPRAIQVMPAQPAKESEKETPKKEEKTFTRAAVVTWVVVGSLVSMFLAILISLGILGLNNGSLSYQTDVEAQRSVVRMQSQIDSLNTQIQAEKEDIESLRTRLDTLERISGRISTLETEISALSAAIDDNSAEIQGFEVELETLSAETEKALEMGARYQSFLEGLKDLLTGILVE